MLGFLVSVLLIFHGSLGLEPGRGQPPHGELAVDLPWHDELCCSLPSAHHNTEGNTAGMASVAAPYHGSPSHRTQPPRCRYRGLKNTSQRGENNQPTGGLCWSILCAVDDDWENVVCDLNSRSPQPEPLVFSTTVISRQHLALPTGQAAHSVTSAEVSKPVNCSHICSIALDNAKRSFAMVATAVLNATIGPVPLRVPARPVKPSPPVNVTHTQTVQGQLVLYWDPSQSAASPDRYKVRYTFNSTWPVWQVVNVSGEPRVFLDLSPRLNYTFQVRCSLPGHPYLWSAWSQPHHIYLDTVSYIPEKVVAKPGQNVTVYCVFNDRSANASSAIWRTNIKHLIPGRQYSAINRWVSQITVLPSQNRIYDLLQCTQEWNIPYSQIYVEGAVIDITCETNGDIDAMTCSWEKDHWITLKFLSRWADVPCVEMERRESSGQVVTGETRRVACQPERQGERVKRCTIHPLRMSCYKLWLEVDSKLGPVRSRAFYVSPTDHVKSHKPSNVEGVSESSKVLRVTWEPPLLPVEGVQCQLRYHSPSTVSAHPKWTVQSPMGASWSEVRVADMCRVYVVQVRCMSTRGVGYWSDWTESVYSVPLNRRAPDNGPDFWRVFEDDLHRNITNVTLLLKHLAMEEQSYCVDGLVVQHQTSWGTIISEKIGMVSSHSFEWNQEVHTVTVEAFNSLGNSNNNIKMTLGRQFKRHCVATFQVEVINSSCVSLLWSLLRNSSVPLAMVVQWSALRPQDKDHTSTGGGPWARLPYTEHSQYLKGDFSDHDQYGFTLYPVFADGEGELAYSTAARGDPAAYMLLMIITFLCIVLFVTLVLSQNQMKRLVWKDVPNPYNCSWAKGLDFQKVNTMDHLFQLPGVLPGWPLLLPTESFCEAVIVDKKNTPPPPATALERVPTIFLATGSSPNSIFSIASLAPGSASVLSDPPSADSTAASSSQSSVNYTTVLITEPLVRLSYNSENGGGSGSSSDEGNFSANNSDISGSFRGGLWELETCRDGETGDVQRSCSYNSVEEFSVTSEQEEDGGVKEDKDLYYLGMDYEGEEEEEKEVEKGIGEDGEREVMKLVLLKIGVWSSGDCSVGSNVLLRSLDEDPKRSADFAPVYLPQFKTALCTRQPKREPQECLPQSVNYGSA
ncbi:leptin receptor isoform X2 [Gadus morhua]|uniref:Fibronectin type-III domain-containing protein n=4 Tax=Gadus morhua TaxID=8049 RepID=A0A8C5ABK3_GADMO|nr:leptin receptor isoform X2 [Gadus morhua]